MDYLISARLIFQDSTSNDASFNLARTIVSPPFDTTYLTGGLAFSLRKTEVNALLLLTDVKSSVQLIAEQGSATKVDRSVSTFSGWGADNSSGKTISAALFDAYSRMVGVLNETDLTKRRIHM